MFVYLCKNKEKIYCDGQGQRSQPNGAFSSPIVESVAGDLCCWWRGVNLSVRARHHPVSQRTLPTSPRMNSDDGAGDICEPDTRRLGLLPTRIRPMIHDRVERTIPNVVSIVFLNGQTLIWTCGFEFRTLLDNVALITARSFCFGNVNKRFRDWPI